MLPALVAGGVGLAAAWLGASGQAKANRANVRLARERMAFEDTQASRQMDFQERMSSSAAQRSVEDFRKSGLNPALAYGTTASSPAGAAGSGAQAQVENVAEAGMSSARSASALNQSMMIARDQNQADLTLKGALSVKAQAEARTSEEQGSLYRAQGILTHSSNEFLRINQPATYRSLLSQALLSELAQPTARAEAAFSRRLGEFRPAVGTILGSARAVGELGRLIPRVGRY